MNSRRKRKGSSKRAEKDSKTQTSLETFRTFLGNKGSEIILRHTQRLFRTFPKGKTAKGFKSFFLSAGDKIKKGASAQDKFLIELFLRFSEIDSSLENLKAVPIYLERQPKTKSFVKAGITGRRHLIYHIENHLQEIYILKCRMSRLLKFLSRHLKKKGRFQTSLRLDQCLQVFEQELKTTLRARGVHVHERRYTDEDLFTLELFDLVRGTDQALQRGYELLLLAERSKRLKWINETNQVLMSMVDTVFRVVNRYVLDE